MALNIYYDKDADLGRLEGKTVAIIGYGSQGHAHAQNLNASGVDVVVGLRKDSSSWPKAESAGLAVASVAEATSRADIVMLTLPDEVAADIYRDEVESNLEAGNYLCVAHGFNIHFEAIAPPPEWPIRCTGRPGNCDWYRTILSATKLACLRLRPKARR